MPILTIQGMPAHKKVIKLLPGLIADLRISVSTELNIQPDSVSVFLPTDLVSDGLGEELICRVDGLLDKPERTLGVRRKVGSVIKGALIQFARRHLPSCHLVEVIILDFDQKRDVYLGTHLNANEMGPWGIKGYVPEHGDL